MEVSEWLRQDMGRDLEMKAPKSACARASEGVTVRLGSLPFTLYKIGVITTNSNQKKTLKHIVLNCPLSIARPATTIFIVHRGV